MKSMIAMSLLTYLAFAHAAFASTKADAILKRSDEGKMPGVTLSFQATVKEFKDKEMTKETRYDVKARGTSAIIETVFPERQVGRKLIVDHDNMYIFTPDTQRPARVSMQQKLTGEVSNGDVARTDFAGDYSAELAGEEKIDGKDVYRLKLNAKRSGVTYSQIEYWVEAGTYLPIKAKFYSISGKLLKTGAYGARKPVLGRTRITQLTIVDALDPSHSSVLIYSKHKKINLPANYFAKENAND